MATEKSTDGVQPAAIDSKFPFLGTPEWLQSFSQAPIKFYATAWNEALGFTARALQDQADYVRTLAACADSAEALKCHGEFARKSWARSCDEGSKVFDAVRANFASASQGK